MSSSPNRFCCGIFPYQFVHPTRQQAYTLVVAIFGTIGSVETSTVFFYSKQHVSEFVNQEWPAMDIDSIATLIGIVTQSNFLPERSDLDEHSVKDGILAVFSVLSTCVSNLLVSQPRQHPAPPPLAHPSL